MNGTLSYSPAQYSRGRPDFPHRVSGDRPVRIDLVRWGASLLIDYEWWKELGQVHTWIDYYSYQTIPVAIGAILAAFVLWLAHWRAVKFSGTELKDHPLYAKLTMLGALLLGWIIAASNIDNWTIMRYIGSRSLPGRL